MIDREQVAEALARCDDIASDGEGGGFYVPDVEIFVAAARAWLDQGDALVEFCKTHMAPRVWTGEDNCVYRASWKASYPEPCRFEWMRYSFDVSEDAIAAWVSRHEGEVSE